jgi:hypothetical protein
MRVNLEVGNVKIAVKAALNEFERDVLKATTWAVALYAPMVLHDQKLGQADEKEIWNIVVPSIGGEHRTVACKTFRKFALNRTASMKIANPRLALLNIMAYIVRDVSTAGVMGTALMVVQELNRCDFVCRCVCADL